ncbi:integrase [Rhizobium sp. BK049]|uniref:site-specific integrase n=1 Tax=Rhizobium sp. BK049 TaxID=2587095 RepID=UPI00161D4714|nr:site-specific integrase [Rhizobium sp. BK049]MBB3352681.1 integrase [Rhizobium sp. BK049]
MAQRVAGLTTASAPRRILDRTAKWLDAPYEADEWTVKDTKGEGTPRTFSFRVRLPNGRILTDEPELYATVKEFVFWIREGNYTWIKDADRHRLYAVSVMQLAYGIVARGHKSFARLTVDDVDAICEASAAGKDGVTSASKLLRAALDKFQSWNDVPGIYAQNNVFDFNRIIDDLHLPRDWGRTSLHREINQATARLNGKTLLRSGTGTVTVQNVHVITTIFEAMFQLRHFMAAPSINFIPFPEGASQRARALGATTEPTPIAPPELVLKFLSESANYIQRNAREVASGYLGVWRSRDTEAWSRELASEMKTEVKWIVAAAFVLIAAFTARRLEEILKLRRNCLAGNDLDGWWLNVYIEKSERKWTWIPIPRIVARAVEALRAFDVDNPDDGQNLFTLNDPVSGRRIKLKATIKGIAHKFGVDSYVDRGGKKLAWEWTPRQFRRFFAVLFIYRYHGKKETLAHHLRHYDLETANDYLRLDPETSAIWLKEMAGYKIFVAHRIAEGDELVGAMGDRLKKFVQRLRRKFEDAVKIVPERMAAIILRSMSKQHLVLTPKPWATCCCPHTEGGCERAACRKEAGFEQGAVGPDFAVAGPAICPACPWALISQGNVGYIELEIEELEASAVQASGVFAELASEKVVVLSKYRESLKR